MAIAAQPPATPKKPVTDEYHGVKVVDDYRWLEDRSDPAVQAWSADENAYARRYLDALPGRPALYEQLKQLYTQASARYAKLHYRSGVLFAMKFQPPKEQPALVALRSVDDPGSESVIVDPNRLDATGGTSIDFYTASTDGKYVAVSLSKGGSESGDVYVYETADGRALDDVVPRVNGGTAGGSVAWNADGSGFYYTRYPRTGERSGADLNFYQQVYFHKLGTPTAQDTYSLGKDFPRIAEIQLSSSEDGRYTLAAMANGDGGEYAHYLLGPNGRWKQIARLSDEIPSVYFGRDGHLYLVSRKDAPMGKVMRMPLDAPDLAGAKTVVAESKVVIDDLALTSHRLYVHDIAGGPSQVRIFDLAGHPMGLVRVPPVSTVVQALSTGGDEILLHITSFLDPGAWYRFDPATGQVARTALAEKGAADFSDAEVVREFAISKDGTKVPLSIIRRKGTKLDGNNPTLLYAYGGYGVNLTPSYSVRRRPLLDHGFVLVIANLRGGGEFGEAWHRAGMLGKKQNVFDDFTAAAQHLIARRYTTAAKLAIEGGSNGGLLMGAALTQHPELYAAVVSHVGIYDMLRVELHPNGAFNVTEFGTVKEQSLFQALYAYSPYHHVVDGTKYPPVLFLTGDNDPRVDPANSRKMTARLQASGSAPLVLLRTSGKSGHGIGTALSERVAQDADVLAFLLDRLNPQ